MDVITADMKTLHDKIEGLRSSATGFRGETTSTSSDNLQLSYISTWDSEADYMAFYNANKADIDSWDAYKTQYVGQYNVAMFDQHTIA
jgi:heme-degrading monooxygenase HmoA